MENFTQYDEYPREMLVYMRHYGPHFNKNLFDFAVGNMTVEKDGKEVPLQPWTREQVNALLLKYGVKLKHNQLYDAAFVANMCKADFYGSSISNDGYVAKYVQDVIDDIDGYDGIVFNRWYADMCYKGIAIDWPEML